MTNPYATIRAALESIRVCDDMTGEREAALAALAELERAAKEPIGELTNAGTVHEHPFTVFYSSKLPIGTKLYTTPPPAQPAPGMPTEAELKDVIREGALVTNGDAWTIAERVFKFIQERTQ